MSADRFHPGNHGLASSRTMCVTTAPCSGFCLFRYCKSIAFAEQAGPAIRADPSGIPLPVKDPGNLLAGFFHQDAHSGVGGFKVNGELMVAEPLAGHGAN